MPVGARSEEGGCMGEIHTEEVVDERFLLRLSKILSDPLRINIFGECNIRETTPRSFREAFGGPSLAKIEQAFVELEQFGWLERVPDAMGPVSDGLDRSYRATRKAIIEESAWSELPASVKSLFTMRVVESLSHRTKEAMKAGTIDARDDAHLTWTGLSLDRQGWEALIARLDALFYSVFEVQEEARERLADSDEEPIVMTVGLLGFESPRR
ncbi:MAG TPA: hypothetical protein VFT19_07430 [Solirubrobacterales bacterium]|nr:hypothetical protein [Solirubrobacterales bacterium]